MALGDEIREGRPVTACGDACTGNGGGTGVGWSGNVYRRKKKKKVSYHQLTVIVAKVIRLVLRNTYPLIEHPQGDQKRH